MLMMVKMMIKFSSNTEPNSDTILLKAQPRLITENSIKSLLTESTTLPTDSSMVDMDLPPGTTLCLMPMMVKTMNQFCEQLQKSKS
jgi:hypothetical protein